jgi:hypothetical protein
MRPATCVLLALLALPLAAQAQWQWIDGNGRKVFSDRPPPADVPARNIIGRPAGGGAGVSAMAAPQAPVPAAPASAPRVDRALEEKARQAEEAEKAKRAEAEAKAAKARQDNCARARQGLATLDSGIRIARVNGQGEREIMDDAARAAEQRRLQGVVQSDCVAR